MHYGIVSHIGTRHSNYMGPSRRCCNFSFAGLKTAVNRIIDHHLDRGMFLQVYKVTLHSILHTLLNFVGKQISGEQHTLHKTLQPVMMLL